MGTSLPLDDPNYNGEGEYFSHDNLFIAKTGFFTQCNHKRHSKMFQHHLEAFKVLEISFKLTLKLNIFTYN